jgi:hypothetical protein
MAQAVKWVLGVVCALALAVAINGAITHAADVRAYRDDSLPAARRETDNMARRHAAAVQARMALEAQERAKVRELTATQDSLALLRSRFTRPDALPLPTTGTVDVEIVRAREEQWLFALNQRDSALRLSMKATDLALAVGDSLRVVVAITDTMYHEERVQRMHWQQLAEKAPVGDSHAKLFGIIPLPAVSFGAQTGVGLCSSGSACGYMGGGISVGYTIHLGGRKS